MFTEVTESLWMAPAAFIFFSKLDSDEGSVLDGSLYITVQMKHGQMKQRKTTNTQKWPKEIARNQHLICNVAAVPQSFAMRKLHEADVLFVHREVGMRCGLNLWTEKVACSCWHRELHKGFRFHKGWTVPAPLPQHNRAAGDVPGTASP